MAGEAGITVPQRDLGFVHFADLSLDPSQAERALVTDRLIGQDGMPTLWRELFIAGAVLHDLRNERPLDEVADLAKSIAWANSDLEDEGTPVLRLGRTSLDAGISAGYGFGFSVSESPSPVAPHLIMPAESTFSAPLYQTASSSLNIVELNKEPISYGEENLDIPMAATVFGTHSYNTPAEEVVDRIFEGGVLAIGAPAINDFLGAIAERELGKDNLRGVAEYAYSIALLGTAVLKDQGARLEIGKNGDLIHSVGIDILGRIIAKGFGSRHQGSGLGPMDKIARRLPAVNFTVADFEPVYTKALELMQEESTYEGLMELAGRNGGNVEDAVRSQTRGFLTGIMGLEIPE
jgi:hypothetical protein